MQSDAWGWKTQRNPTSSGIQTNWKHRNIIGYSMSEKSRNIYQREGLKCLVLSEEKKYSEDFKNQFKNVILFIVCTTENCMFLCIYCPGFTN